jgi:hypothetical protein
LFQQQENGEASQTPSSSHQSQDKPEKPTAEGRQLKSHIMLSLLQYHKKMLLQANSDDEESDSNSHESVHSQASSQVAKKDVFKVRLNLLPFDEQTCARLKQRSNNNVDPEVTVETTID